MLKELQEEETAHLHDLAFLALQIDIAELWAVEDSHWCFYSDLCALLNPLHQLFIPHGSYSLPLAPELSAAPAGVFWMTAQYASAKLDGVIRASPECAD